MLFTCEYCRTPIAPGRRTCRRTECVTRDVERQSRDKARELGMHYPFPERPFPARGSP